MPGDLGANEIGVFADVVGQAAAVAACRAAVHASRPAPGGPGSGASRLGGVPGPESASESENAPGWGNAAMTHAWLFTGPPGSGRSVAARAFAAALQCKYGGCGQCTACHTVLAGTHGDVRAVVPEGLTIGVKEMRAVVQRAASRPSTGRWQIVLIEDADRLSESAANALLKSIEEPPAHTVFLLCAPSTHPDDVSVTIRSRCRVVNLVSPAPDAIAHVLIERDGIDPQMATWAASVCGGHVGRARALARHDAGRRHRAKILAVPGTLRSVADVFDQADELLAEAKAQAIDQADRRNDAEREELRVALGAGGTGKGAASAARGSAGALKELERKQKSRATRTERDALDRALIDLSGFYRDVAARAMGAGATPINPDLARDVEAVATAVGAEGAVRRIDQILAARTALERNVKPRIAVENLMMHLRLPR